MTIDSVGADGRSYIAVKLADPAESGVFTISMNGEAIHSDTINPLGPPSVSVVTEDCDVYTFDIETPCDIRGMTLDSALSENVSYEVEEGATPTSARVTLRLNDREKPGRFALRANNRLVIADTMTGVNHVGVPWVITEGSVHIYPEPACDSVTFEIVNRGTRPVVIESARAMRGVEFTVPEDQFPLIIPPNYEKQTLKICCTFPQGLKPDSVIRDSIIIELPCVDMKCLVWAKRSTIDSGRAEDTCGTTIGLRSASLSKPLVRSYPPVVDGESMSATLRFEQIIPANAPPAIIDGALHDLFGMRIRGAEIVGAMRREEPDYSVESGTLRLDLRDSPQGYYIIAITTPDGIVSYPITIVR